MDNLTKDAQKLASQMYKIYLEKIKAGIDKFNAKHLSFREIKDSARQFSDPSDLKLTLLEIARAGYGSRYLDGSFKMNDQFIIQIESRFKKGASAVIDFISKFLP